MERKLDFNNKEDRFNWMDFNEQGEMEFSRFNIGKLKLYWVEDRDDYESWFVISDCYSDAEEFYSLYEFGEIQDGNISALPICEISLDLIKKFKLRGRCRCNGMKGIYGCYPPPDFFDAIGAIELAGPRVTYLLNGVTYMEGSMQAKITNLERYGVENVSKNEDIIKKIIKVKLANKKP